MRQSERWSDDWPVVTVWLFWSLAFARLSLPITRMFMGVAESSGIVGGAGAAAVGAGDLVGDLVGDGVRVAVAPAEALEGEGPDDVLPDPAMTAARTTTSASRTASPAESHSRRRLSMSGKYHSGGLNTHPGKPQFGHKNSPCVVPVSRQNNVPGAR